MNSIKGRKIPTYLSPSAISKYRKDPEEYYLHYIATYASTREPQNQAMSIGSAFDAYAKSYLHEQLFGKNNDPKYAFDNIFCAQVESQWRDWAKLHGMYVFEEYRKSGALSDLLIDLQQAVNTPKFEIEIMGVISGQRESIVTKDINLNSDDYNQNDNIPPMTLLGKPDVFYMNKHGATVVVDWKVNGYCSKANKSPMPGYIRLRDNNYLGGGKTVKLSQHKDCRPVVHKGTLINGAKTLDQCTESGIDWATQLSIYAWLGGVEVGDDFIAGIDQICCNNSSNFNQDGSTKDGFPTLRFAEHRMRVSKQFQLDTFKLAQDLWSRTHSSYFFRELSKEESDARCEMLDTTSLHIQHMDPEFLEMTGSGKKWK